MPIDMIAATVHAGTAETPYLRAGRGAPIILLTTRNAGALAEDPLVAALVRDFRVFVPRLPLEPVHDSWLRGVMDCLGIAEARILIDGPSLPSGEAAPQSGGLTSVRQD